MLYWLLPNSASWALEPTESPLMVCHTPWGYPAGTPHSWIPQAQFLHLRFSWACLVLLLLWSCPCGHPVNVQGHLFCLHLCHSLSLGCQPSLHKNSSCSSFLPKTQTPISWSREGINVHLSSSSPLFLNRGLQHKPSFSLSQNQKALGKLMSQKWALLGTVHKLSRHA